MAERLEEHEVQNMINFRTPLMRPGPRPEVYRHGYHESDDVHADVAPAGTKAIHDPKARSLRLTIAQFRQCSRQCRPTLATSSGSPIG
jgi:hypothetical protein